MRISRANAIPETAFVISLALTVLYGALQMALVGFNQLSADGATFVGDHAAVAYYNSPTSSDATYAKQVGQGVFTHANGTYTASNPTSGTYEVDYNASEKTIASFFPSQLTVQSRIIEPSVATSTTSLGNCSIGKLNISTSAITTAQGSAVGLLQSHTASGLFSVASDANGKNAVSLSASLVNSQVTTLTSIKTELATISTDINLLAGPLDLTTGTLSTLLGALGLSNVNSVVSSDLTSQLNLALGGTLTSTNLLTQSGLTSQISSVLGLLSGLTSTIMTTLTGSSAGSPFSSTGLFGSSGPLMALSALEQQLSTLDSLAPSGC